jgi:KDO2-lipid IV(A) lauroyltransferase
MFWYLIFRLGAFLVRHVPHRWGTRVARWLGRFIFRVSPVAAASCDNMAQVLGRGADPHEAVALAQRAFEERVLNYYDMLWLSTLPVEELGARTHIEGIEQVTRLVKQGQGAVVASGHIGPMEYMIQALAAYDLPCIGIVERLKSEKLHRYLLELRSVHGLDLISTDASLVEVYRRIKRGEILLSMADRDSTGTGLITDVFGEPAWVPDGYARLAVRAGVPVVFGYCIRTDGGAKGRVCPPIFPNGLLPKEQAVRDVIARTVHYMEQAIRENPSAWILSTPIWRLAEERLEGEAG